MSIRDVAFMIAEAMEFKGEVKVHSYVWVHECVCVCVCVRVRVHVCVCGVVWCVRVCVWCGVCVFVVCKYHCLPLQQCSLILAEQTGSSRRQPAMANLDATSQSFSLQTCVQVRSQ